MRFQALQHLGEFGQAKQLGGVGRDGTYRQYIKVVTLFRLYDDAVDVAEGTAEIVGQALRGRTHVSRGRSAAQVTVDNQHLFAFEGY